MRYGELVVSSITVALPTNPTWISAVAPALLNTMFTRFTMQTIDVLEVSGVVYVQTKSTDSDKFP